MVYKIWNPQKPKKKPTKSDSTYSVQLLTKFARFFTDKEVASSIPVDKRKQFLATFTNDELEVLNNVLV